MRSAYQPLHHKYRPQRLDQLVGQEASISPSTVVRSLVPET